MHDRPGGPAARMAASRQGQPRIDRYASAMTRPGSLEVEEAADRLRRARGGDLDDVPPNGAVLVVDLDTEGVPFPLDQWTSCPCVMVGVGDPDGSPAGLDGVDVALTGSAAPPRPWVGVEDLEGELRRLASSVGSSPMASAVLVQVLRLAGRHGLVDDLVVESLAYSALQSGPEFAGWLAARRTPPAPAPAASEAARPERSASGPAVRIERSGDRLDLTLCRPPVRNAYSAVLRDQLCEGLGLVAADPSISEVHLWGEGPDFCSGGDLTEFGTLPDPVTAHLVRTGRSAARLLGLVGARVVAHLHGACIGAGIELPALAGRVVADPGTRVWLPELGMGLIPGAGGTASLPRRIGRHRAAWLALTGQAIDAHTAHRWGLVDELVAA